MAGSAERSLVRIFVAVALCAALVTCASVPLPEDLPAVALRQAGLYRLEVALLVFYGCLLLVTPAFSGLIRGRLPIEISTRGAKFVEEDERSTELDEAVIRKLEGDVTDLARALADTQFETERLSRTVERDRRQQEVDSNR